MPASRSGGTLPTAPPRQLMVNVTKIVRKGRLVRLVHVGDSSEGFLHFFCI